MSAPHATGAMALLLEADPTLTQAQLVSALQAGARHATGPDAVRLPARRRRVNVVGAQAALDASETGTVDTGQSWYELSSGYVRADGTTPVWGTVELRYADGRPAVDVEDGALTSSSRTPRPCRRSPRSGPGSTASRSSRPLAASGRARDRRRLRSGDRSASGRSRSGPIPSTRRRRSTRPAARAARSQRRWGSIQRRAPRNRRARGGSRRRRAQPS